MCALSQAAPALTASCRPVEIVRGSGTADGATTLARTTASGAATLTRAGRRDAIVDAPTATSATQSGKVKIRWRGASRSALAPVAAATARIAGGTTKTSAANAATAGCLGTIFTAPRAASATKATKMM